MSPFDSFDVTHNYSIRMFSINNVPYPLDQYLSLQNKMTINQAAIMALKWGYGERK